MPRTVECELTHDLVDSCIPGDVVTVTGIIRGINNYMDIGGGMIFQLLVLVILPTCWPVLQVTTCLDVYVNCEGMLKFVSKDN